jgi:(1->4)-alpha-D-glucan 1-alpha-D-glucosylmutase
VERAVRDPELGRHVAALVDRVLDAGRAGALAQLLAQLLAPGVPDVYQGSETWDLSLVDPDNRRGITPERRRQLVEVASAATVADAWADRLGRDDGAVRATLLRTALDARRRHGEAVAGGYTPCGVSGPDAARVLAFGRGEPTALVVVVARPGPGARVEADAAVDLPAGPWHDLLGGPPADGGRLELSDRAVPLALLERTD